MCQFQKLALEQQVINYDHSTIPEDFFAIYYNTWVLQVNMAQWGIFLALLGWSGWPGLLSCHHSETPLSLPDISDPRAHTVNCVNFFSSQGRQGDTGTVQHLEKFPNQSVAGCESNLSARNPLVAALQETSFSPPLTVMCEGCGSFGRVSWHDSPALRVKPPWSSSGEACGRKSHHDSSSIGCFAPIFCGSQGLRIGWSHAKT